MEVAPQKTIFGLSQTTYGTVDLQKFQTSMYDHHFIGTSIEFSKERKNRLENSNFYELHGNCAMAAFPV